MKLKKLATNAMNFAIGLSAFALAPMLARIIFESLTK